MAKKLFRWFRLAGTILAGLAFTALPAPAAETLPGLAAVVRQMKPGSWYEVPKSSIRRVLVPPSQVQHGKDPIMVIHDWNGAAFDGRRLYFHGGGHRDYGGNEIYTYDLATMAWARLTEPARIPDGTKDNPCPKPVSGPPSIHTYDGIVWSPLTRTLFRFGDLGYCLLRSYGTKSYAWEFDPVTKVWTQLDDPPPPRSFYALTAIDPKTGHIIYSNNLRIYDFNPVTKTYDRRQWGARAGIGNLEIDPVRRLGVEINRRGVLVFALDGKTLGAPRQLKLKGDVPVAAYMRQLGSWGLAYDSKRRLFVLWGGASDVYTLDIGSGEMVRYANSTGPAPKLHPKYGSRVYSKWFYVPEADVFVGYNNVNEGVWLYRLPAKLRKPQPPRPARKPIIAGDIRVCPYNEYSDSVCNFVSLAKAFQKAKPGDKIVLAPGVYAQGAVIKTPGVTVVGEIGADGARAHLKGVAVAGKGALVVSADKVTIEGIECSRIAVGGGNGSCIRLQAPNLTVRNVYFHDNEEHILGGTPGGVILIENSLFGPTLPRRRSHGIYISKTAGTLRFIGNRMLGIGGLGHAVKCGARVCDIERNVIAGLDGRDGRAIDIVLGGDVTIRDNVFEKGANSENNDMIGLALEGPGKGFHAVNKTLIENNLFIFDRAVGRLLRSASPGKIVVRGNRFVNMTRGYGAPVWDAGGNRLFTSRKAAGLRPAPWVPAAPYRPARPGAE